MIIVSVTSEDGVFKYGTLYGTKNLFTFEAKVFEEPSKNAINKDHIVMLSVSKQISRWERETIINYDRGWDIRPKTSDEKEILEAITRYFEDPENCKLCSLPPDFRAEERTAKKENKALNIEYRRCMRDWKRIRKEK